MIFWSEVASAPAQLAAYTAQAAARSWPAMVSPSYALVAAAAVSPEGLVTVPVSTVQKRWRSLKRPAATRRPG
jgi:hypothetical protein